MDLSSALPEAMRGYLDDARIRALVLFLGFVILAALADLVVRLLVRLASGTKTEIDDRALLVLHKPIFYSVILVGIHFSLESLLAPDPTSQLNWAPVLLKTIAIIIWSTTLTRLLTTTLRYFATRRTQGTLQLRTLPIFLNVGRVLIFGFSSYLLFLAWSINISAWLASAGVVGIAVGFAAKDSLANLFSGFFIITDSPYGIGDYIVLDTGERGKVQDIGLRSTRILTRDDLEVTIPNSIMGNAKIINESGGPYRHQRLRIPVGVAYGSDIDKIREVLMSLATDSGLVLQHPEPRVRFRGFGDSSLDFELLCWIDLPEDRGRVRDGLNCAIYKAFAKHSIEIPFPQRDLHVRQWPSLTSS